MKLIDLNLLLYAVNRDSRDHAAAKAWVDDALSGDETIALPWTVLLGFIRISTHARIMERPLAMKDALAVVASWLERPQVVTLGPGREHWTILRELLESTKGGNIAMDAHLAALAIEHGATLHSTDRDFARFTRLRFVNPLD